MKNIKDYNLDELKQELTKLEEKPFRAEQVVISRKGKKI